MLGRALRLRADEAGHDLVTPRHDELDLFDPDAVAAAVRGFDAVLHLATRVGPFEHLLGQETHRENDRLRTEASRNLVDGAMAAGAAAYVVPTGAFLQPEGSTLDAEREAERFARSGRGVVLRLGVLDGPGTGWPEPLGALGATLHATDAARALLAALSVPSGVYNVCRDGERVSNETFVAAAAGWQPHAWSLPGRRVLDPEGHVADLAEQCEVLRSLHRRDDPLLLPNVWDVATARAVVEAGYPAVATTSGGVAFSIGYGDHENAPASEMFAAAARIVRGVEVPVTVDAEAGYGLTAADLVGALRAVGAAGCNLEDTDYATWGLRDVALQAEWLAEVRRAADEADYPLVINARTDVFVGAYLGGGAPGHQDDLVADAIHRAKTYLEAGADCVYPILLWEPQPLRRFMAEVDGPVNVVQLSESPRLADLAAMGVARVSWGYVTYTTTMAGFERQVAGVRD